MNSTYHENEEFYQSLLKAIPDLIIRTDRVGKIIYANEPGLKSFGIEDPDEILGKNLLEFLVPDEHERAVRKAKTMLRESFGIAEYQVIISDRVFDCEIMGNLIFDKGGKIIGMAYVIRDISEKKRTARKLAEKEANYTNLVEQMQLGLALHEMLFDENGMPVDYRFLFINPAYEKHTGLKADQLTGKTLLEVLPNTESYWIENFGQVAKTGIPLTYENYSAELDRYYDVVAYRPQEGQFAVIIEDITKRRQTLDELRIKDWALATSINAIAMSDLEGKLTYVNQSFLKLWGYSGENEVIGRHANEFWQYTDEPDAVIIALRERGQWIGELEGKHSNNSLFQTEVVASLIFDDKGKPLCMQASFSDITERKNAEIRLRENQRFTEAVINTTPAMIYIYDVVEKKNIWTNQYHQDFFTVHTDQPDRLTYDEVNGFVHPEDFAILNEKANQMIDDPSIDRFETEIRLKSGTGWKWMYIINSVFKADEQGKATHTLGVLFDIDDRKKAEEELSKNQKRLQSYFEAAPYGIFIADAHGKYSYVNSTACNITGYTEKELLTKQIAHLLTPESFDEGMNSFKVLDKEGHGYKELLLQTASGEKRWFSLAAVKISDDEMLGFKQDITERREADNKIRYNEERLRLMVKNLSSIIVIISAEGVQRYVSPAVEKLSGFTPEEVTGKNINEVIHPDDLQEVNEAWYDCINNPEKIIKVAYRHIHKTKGWAYFEATAQSFLNEPSVNAVIASVRDISEQRQHEITQRMHYNIAHAMAIVENVDGLFKLVDDELRQAFEIKRLSIVNTTDKSHLLKVIWDSSMHLIDRHIPAEKSLSDMVIRNGTSLFVKKSELMALMLKRQSKFVDADFDIWLGFPLLVRNKIMGVMIVEAYEDKEKLLRKYIDNLDLIAHQLSTYIEKLIDREELIVAKEKAEESDRLKTAFLNNISHEIRSPLNGIIGFGNFLLQGEVTDKEREFYRLQIEENTERLVNTVNDYIDISLLTTGTIPNKPQPINVHTLMKKAAGEISPKCEQKNLTFTTFSEGVPANFTINADPELITKALLHLLNNAVKFTRQGKIIFTGQLQEQMLKFSIQDSGIGIGDEARTRIFEPFGQEALSLSKSKDGSGLGLSIVKGIAELYGSRIWVDSIKGQGSIFHFEIPVKESTVEPAISKEPENVAARTIRPLVLIAEDEESNSLYLKILLKKAFCDVIHVVNGLQAVEACIENPKISMVFMDIKMPEMNGIEATQRIKSIRPGLPVVAITALALTGDERRIRDAGCDDYLAKPAKIDKILEIINKYKEQITGEA